MASLTQALVRARRGLRYGAILILSLALSERRRFIHEVRALARELPVRMDSPLPVALARLTPESTPQRLDSATIRQIVDAMAAFGAGRPLGICLRRSLLRYYYLRRAGLPVVLNFGARRLGQDIGGHAWLTLDGRPYHEAPEHYLNYVLMFNYP